MKHLRSEDGTKSKISASTAWFTARANFAELESCLKSGKFGCIKIHLGYVRQFAYDKNCEPACRLAEKYNVPVVFHTGDIYSVEAKLRYADPMTIDDVAVDLSQKTSAQIEELLVKPVSR